MGRTRALLIVLLIVLLILILPSFGYAQGSVSGGETPISYSGSNVAIVPPNTPATNFTSPTGINTFLIPISNPSVSIRIYVTNNTVNACSAFTAQLWAVSDAQTSSFNNSLANWQVIPLQGTNGNLFQTLNLSIPVSGITYFDSTAISAPRIALQLINTGGCASTSIEVTGVVSQVAKTSPLISASAPGTFNQGSANKVQGVVATSASLTGINPLAIGGNDISGNSQFYGICFGGQGGFHCDGGMPIGMRQTAGGTFTTQVTPQSAIDGPLVVEGFVANASEGGTLHQLVKSSATSQLCNGTTGCAGLYVADSGYFSQTTLSSFVTNSTIPLWSTPGGSNSVIQTCHFSVNATNNSGTTPTLDVFIQDSPDNSTWDDRVHFAQVTTVASNQVAGVAGTSANETPRVRANLTTPAGTTVAGPIDGFGRAVLNLGGTTPNYTATVTVNCK